MGLKIAPDVLANPGRAGSAVRGTWSDKQKKAPQSFRFAGHKSGNDLLSRENPVSSALESLTTVFGMGTGVASPVESPENRTPPRGHPVFCASVITSVIVLVHSLDQRISILERNQLRIVTSCYFTCSNFEHLLNALRKKVKPHGKLVLVSSTYCYAYTSNLSTL